MILLVGPANEPTAPDRGSDAEAGGRREFSASTGLAENYGELESS